MRGWTKSFKMEFSVLSNTGEGLIAVMMAVGIGAILIMGITSSLSVYQKGETSTRATMDAGRLISEISLILSDEESCTSSLGGQDASATKLSIYYPYSTPKREITQLGAAVFHNVNIDPSSVTTNKTGTVKFGNLTFNIDKLGEGYGPSNVNRKLLLSFITDSSNKIVKCSTSKIAGSRNDGMSWCASDQQCQGTPMVCLRNPGTGAGLRAGGDIHRTDLSTRTGPQFPYFFFKPQTGRNAGPPVWQAMISDETYEPCDKGIFVIPPPES